MPGTWPGIRAVTWVGLDGLEPSTSSLSGKRSNRAELQAPAAPRDVRAALTPGKCRRDRLSHSPGNPSVSLPEGDLDTAAQVGDQVVDHGSDRGQSGDQDNVHRAEQHRVAEDPGGREPVADAGPRGRARA